MSENKLCPKCGLEMEQCENCENTGCLDCDNHIVTRNDMVLCSECGAMCKAECDAQRAVGCGSCALFSDEDDEGSGWCDLHQEPKCYIDKCDDRLPKSAGGISEVADLCIGLDTIRTDIDQDSPKDEFNTWYDYWLRFGMLASGIVGAPTPNFDHEASTPH